MARIAGTLAVILSLLALSLSLSHAHRPIYLHEGGGAVSSIVVPQEDANPAAVPLPLKEQTADASRRPIEFASSVAVPDPDADRALTVPLRLGDEPGVGSDGSRYVALTLRRPRNSRCRQGRHAVSLLLGFPQGRRIPGHFPGRRNFPARPQRLAGGAVDQGGLRGWIPEEEHVKLFRNAQEEAVKEKRFRKHDEEEEVNKEKKKRFRKHEEEEEEEEKKRFRKHEEEDEMRKEKKRFKKHGGFKNWFKKQKKSLSTFFST